MAEYIEREKIYADISRLLICKSTADLTNCEDGWTSAISEAMDVIKNAPTSDVRPERHGHWVKESKMMGAFQRNLCICSICGLWYDEDSGGEIFKYCPNCGAKMDGGKNNETD